MSMVFYIADSVLSAILYNILISIPYQTILPYSTTLGYNLFLVIPSLNAVPFVSAVASFLIIATILMSLRYTGYYGVGKSVITIAAYLYLYFSILRIAPGITQFIATTIGLAAFYSILFGLIGLSAIEIVLLFLYQKAQKELYG